MANVIMELIPGMFIFLRKHKNSLLHSTFVRYTFGWVWIENSVRNGGFVLMKKEMKTVDGNDDDSEENSHQ